MSSNGDTVSLIVVSILCALIVIIAIRRWLRTPRTHLALDAEEIRFQQVLENDTLEDLDLESDELQLSSHQLEQLKLLESVDLGDAHDPMFDSGVSQSPRSFPADIEAAPLRLQPRSSALESPPHSPDFSPRLDGRGSAPAAAAERPRPVSLLTERTEHPPSSSAAIPRLDPPLAKQPRT